MSLHPLGIGPSSATLVELAWLRQLIILLAMHELPLGAAALVRPDRVWSRAEVLGRPSPVPAVAATYAWYFNQLPATIDTTKRQTHNQRPLGRLRGQGWNS